MVGYRSNCTIDGGCSLWLCVSSKWSSAVGSGPVQSCPATRGRVRSSADVCCRL